MSNVVVVSAFVITIAVATALHNVIVMIVIRGSVLDLRKLQPISQWQT